MARRRRRDILEAGIDFLFAKWFGGFLGGLFATFAKKAIAKYKADLIKWIETKWLKESLDDFPDGDEQDLLPDDK